MITISIMAYGTLFAIWWPTIQTETYIRNMFSVAALITTGSFIKIARQKTAYHYRIFEDRAALDRHVYYSRSEINIIKSVALLCMLGFLAVALIAGSILLFVGPAAIGFLAGLRLFHMKIPIIHEDSLPWIEYNFVTVDRKRKIIVTHYSDLTLGFEARLPDDKLFEQYLDFLSKSLPSTAKFTEMEWKHDLI